MDKKVNVAVCLEKTQKLGFILTFFKEKNVSLLKYSASQHIRDNRGKNSDRRRWCCWAGVSD